MMWWATLMAEGIRFDVKSDLGSKCVSEEIQTNVIVLADFSVANHDNSSQPHNISIKVSSPYGNSVYYTENVALGQFGFTASESGNYVACFWIPNSPYGAVATVDLDWKVGVAAKDWEMIAKKEKIEGVELELRKIEVAIESIHENLLYMKSRESELREISEITNSRVAWFSIMSLTVCLSVSAWQLWHLKRFFEKKKLI
ncbi:hypothetical protein SUGI_0985560 [Cryptomeria japonica]|nr:hypothetical protein SUGI_0985560 [Cryptomeria japonica]